MERNHSTYHYALKKKEKGKKENFRVWVESK